LPRSLSNLTGPPNAVVGKGSVSDTTAEGSGLDTTAEGGEASYPRLDTTAEGSGLLQERIADANPLVERDQRVQPEQQLRLDETHTGIGALPPRRPQPGLASLRCHRSSPGLSVAIAIIVHTPGRRALGRVAEHNTQMVDPIKPTDPH